MPTLTVHLTEATSSFLSEEVEKGNYLSAEGAVEALLSKVADREREFRAKSEALEKALQDGIESGLAEGDMDDVFRRVAQRTGLSQAAVFAE